MSDINEKRIIFLTIAFFTFIILVLLCHFIFLPTPSAPIYELKDGWDVYYNDETFENISLNDLREKIGNLSSKGDEITLVKSMTSDDSIVFPTVSFLSRYSAVELYIDNDLVYSKDLNKISEKRFIGVHYNVVPFEPASDSFEIKIKLHVNEDDAYSHFEAPLFGDYYDVMVKLFYINLFALSSGIFLIIFGAAFFLISLIFYRTLPGISLQLSASLLFIVLGSWILSYYRLLDLFMDTKGHMTEIEYISLYLLVPLIYIIIGSIQDHYTDWVFLVVSSTSSLLSLFLIVLHFSGVMHMNRTLLYYHCLAVVCVLFLAVTIGKDIYQKKLLPSESIQLIGLAFLAASFVLNMAAYTLEMAGILPVNLITKHTIPMGGLILVFATLINYFIYISESYARRKEYESLTHLAYADGLTDLPNRSRYEKYLSDLESKNSSYCIISMDLNGLKQVNDNEGHIKGDKYLLDFSTTLTQSFGDKAFLARIGGDEFVAILAEEYWNEVESLLGRLSDALEVKNVLYPEFNRSVAAGYAFSYEVKGNDSHEVYLLADKRMYEKKKRMHEKLGITARI